MSAPPETPRRRPRVRRLILRDFRSYAALDVRFDADLVAFVGENGAGKTNLLEALSLFSPGRAARAAFPSASRSRRTVRRGRWASASNPGRTGRSGSIA